jgi:hypothetical protein
MRDPAEPVYNRTLNTADGGYCNRKMGPFDEENRGIL